jgi:23S rRNA (adenine2030-N6)-methyltransferase
MNYRHAFHAGNFADVFKHVLLTRIVVYMLRKPTALRVIDTHAGAGCYDLAGAEALRTGEARDGVLRLRAAIEAGAAHAPAALALLEPYLAALELAQPLYPGSPLIAAGLLRPQDRLVCCELHAPTAAALAARLGRRGKVVERDGYMALKAFLPPPERRGVALIDPPFETPDEFARLAAALGSAWRKWPTGVYVVWYPIKDTTAVAGFEAALRREGVARALRLALQVAQPWPDGPLAASGLVVVNPPFGLEDEARILLPFLAANLAVGPDAAWRVDWLSP